MIKRRRDGRPQGSKRRLTAHHGIGKLSVERGRAAINARFGAANGFGLKAAIFRDKSDESGIKPVDIGLDFLARSVGQRLMRIAIDLALARIDEVPGKTGLFVRAAFIDMDGDNADGADFRRLRQNDLVGF